MKRSVMRKAERNRVVAAFDTVVSTVATSRAHPHFDGLREHTVETRGGRFVFYADPNHGDPFTPDVYGRFEEPARAFAEFGGLVNRYSGKCNWHGLTNPEQARHLAELICGWRGEA